MNNNMAYGRPISSTEGVIETDVSVAYGHVLQNNQELRTIERTIICI